MNATDQPDLIDIRAERAIIGAALLTGNPRTVDALFDRVDPGDFANGLCREIASALLELRADGHHPDWRLVVGVLRSRGTLDGLGGEHAVEAMTADGVAIGALAAMCDTVAALARDRRRLNATYSLQVALQDRTDPAAWDAALGELFDADAARTGGWHSPHDLAEGIGNSIDNPDRVRWPWPLSRLNHITGGARRGQVTFIGGATSHGKSVLIDMTLQSMADAGAKTALFLNEMTPEERAERMAANLASVRYGRIQAATTGTARLEQKEVNAITKAMASQKVAVSACHGWTADQIIREARRRDVQVMALDLVQKLPWQPGMKRHEMLEAAVQRFDAFAKDTGCHVILGGQLNRGRVGLDGRFPVPGLADVKDCAELTNGPDNVLFVWREQAEGTLDPQDDGSIRIAKYRGAPLETIKVQFVGEYQRWSEQQLVYGPGA